MIFPEKVGVVRGYGIDKIHELSGIVFYAGEVGADGIDASGA